MNNIRRLFCISNDDWGPFWWRRNVNSEAISPVGAVNNQNWVRKRTSNTILKVEKVIKVLSLLVLFQSGESETRLCVLARNVCCLFCVAEQSQLRRLRLKNRVSSNTDERAFGSGHKWTESFCTHKMKKKRLLYVMAYLVATNFQNCERNEQRKTNLVTRFEPIFRNVVATWLILPVVICLF